MSLLEETDKRLEGATAELSGAGSQEWLRANEI
jgi:hypothetical protein